MRKIGPFSQFSSILCISLKRNAKRREHIQNEFDRVGIYAYQFIDAYDKTSKKVEEVYRSDFVAKFPPCFRCGQDVCNCENKSLIRPQIGNWLSHISAWRSIDSHNANLSLICEDDVKFTDGIYDSLQLIAESQEINTCLDSAKPVLIRLGWALCDDHRNHCIPVLSKKIRMANPCYAINGAMANRLLDSLEEINTTSDIYVHRIIGPDTNHFTVIPPPAYELSWSTGELLSEIRPKRSHVDHLRGLLAKIEKDDPEYQAIATMCEKELNRLDQFAEFNKAPRPDYRSKFDLI